MEHMDITIDFILKTIMIAIVVLLINHILKGDQ